MANTSVVITHQHVIVGMFSPNVFHAKAGHV